MGVQYELCNKSRAKFKAVGFELETASLLGKVDSGTCFATIRIPLQMEIREVVDVVSEL
jgi:hypothetical protein